MLLELATGLPNPEGDRMHRIVDLLEFLLVREVSGEQRPDMCSVGQQGKWISQIYPELAIREARLRTSRIAKLGPIVGSFGT
jgi:hypothetical protein